MLYAVPTLKVVNILLAQSNVGHSVAISALTGVSTWAIDNKDTIPEPIAHVVACTVSNIALSADQFGHEILKLYARLLYIVMGL